MQDPRIATLAQNLVNYSTALKPGEKVLIETIGFELPLTRALINAAYDAGAIPFVDIKHGDVLNTLLKRTIPEQLDAIARWECTRMSEMDAYIAVRARDNIFDLANVPADKLSLYDHLWMHKVHHEIRVPKTKWVVLRYPNDSMAQMAAMTTDDFEDFYFRVCNLDYAKMSRAMDPLVELLNKSEEVRLVGPGLDLAFSIAGIPAIKCAGAFNIPDGEVYTAPVRDSVNGNITYNTPSINEGITFENIHFRFENGRIVEATAGANTTRLNEILDRDEGARYIGEFALGVNPYILKPINDTLFDEKIMGSFHFTPGACYDEAPNGNESVIHWDLVHIQTQAYGGGEIYLDGRLIRKDGLFVAKELLPLNPENLI